MHLPDGTSASAVAEPNQRLSPAAAALARSSSVLDLSLDLADFVDRRPLFPASFRARFLRRSFCSDLNCSFACAAI